MAAGNHRDSSHKTLASRWPAGRAWILPALYQVALIIATLLAIAGAELDDARRPWMIALVVSCAIWHWLSVVDVQRSGPVDARFTTVALLVLAALWYPLVLISPVFYVVLLGIFSQTVAFLPIRWIVAVSAILAILAALSLATIARP